MSAALTTKVLVALCVCPIVAAPVIVATSPKARTAVAKKMHKAANRIAPKPQRTHTELPPCAPTMYEPPLTLPPTTPPIQFAPMNITPVPEFVQVPGTYIPPYDEGGWGGGNPVPEPDTWALMVIGFGAIGGVMRAKTFSVNFSTKILEA